MDFDYEQEVMLNGRMQADCSELVDADCKATAEFVDNQVVECNVEINMAG